MRTRLPLLLGLVLMLSAAGYTAAVTEAPAATPTDRPFRSPAVDAQAVASDPFLALSDITSSAPEQRAVCPCQPGFNCCGDNPNELGCGINWACQCRKSGCVM
jgi:hypothetical protein